MSLRKSARKLSLLCGLVFPVLLTGCGVTTQKSRLAAPLSAGASPVTVSITLNSRDIAPFDRITVKHVGSNEERAVWLMAGMASRDTSLYMDVLPVGEYQVVSLENTTSGRKVKLVEGARLLGNFRVNGGGPVDLGRLILTPINHKVLVGRSKHAINNSTLINHYAPQFAQQFSKEPAGGWLDARNPADLVEEYAMSKPTELTCITEKDNSFVMAGGRMGALLLRSAKGDWTNLQSKSVAALNCATPVDLPNEDILVAGEFGTLLGHIKGTRDLRRISTGNLPFGNLLRVLGSKEHGWYIARQEADDVTLYYSPELENGNWTEVRHVPGSRFWIWPTPGGLAYTNGINSIESLEFASGKWSSSAMPDGKGFDFTISPTGMMFVKKWMSRHVSYDAGKHWEELKIELGSGVSPTGAIQQMSDGSLVVMATTRPGDGSALYRSVDKGQSWQEVKRFDSYYWVKALKSVPLLQVEDKFGSPYMDVRSSSDGKNWMLEYSSFDRAAYEHSVKNGFK